MKNKQNTEVEFFTEYLRQSPTEELQYIKLYLEEHSDETDFRLSLVKERLEARRNGEQRELTKEEKIEQEWQQAKNNLLQSVADDLTPLTNWLVRLSPMKSYLLGGLLALPIFIFLVVGTI